MFSIFNKMFTLLMYIFKVKSYKSVQLMLLSLQETSLESALLKFGIALFIRLLWLFMALILATTRQGYEQTRDKCH